MVLKKYKYPIIIFYCICIIMLIFASFFDLKIDIALNNPDNIFAVWFYRTGEMPSRLICPIAGALIYFLNDNKLIKVIGLLICIGGSAYLGYYIADYFFTEEYKYIYGIIWGIGFGIVLLITFNFINIPEKNKGILLKIAVIAIVVFAAELIIINGIKMIWGRVRFRDLITDGSYDAFTNWFIPNGYNGNNSFPSGHTASAAMIFLSMFLPYISNKWKNKTQLLFWCSLIYTAVVAFTRLIMGAHYLSDVTIGAVIGFTCVLIGLVYFESSEKRRIARLTE